MHAMMAFACLLVTLGYAVLASMRKSATLEAAVIDASKLCADALTCQTSVSLTLLVSARCRQRLRCACQHGVARRFNAATVHGLLLVRHLRLTSLLTISGPAASAFTLRASRRLAGASPLCPPPWTGSAPRACVVCSRASQAPPTQRRLSRGHSCSLTRTPHLSYFNSGFRL